MSTEAVPFRDIHSLRRDASDAASWLLLARSDGVSRAMRLRAASEAVWRAQVVVGTAPTLHGGPLGAEAGRLASEASELWHEAEEWIAAMAPRPASVAVRRGWLAPVDAGLRAAVAANEAA